MRASGPDARRPLPGRGQRRRAPVHSGGSARRDAGGSCCAGMSGRGGAIHGRASFRQQDCAAGEPARTGVPLPPSTPCSSPPRACPKAGSGKSDQDRRGRHEGSFHLRRSNYMGTAPAPGTGGIGTSRYNSSNGTASMPVSGMASTASAPYLKLNSQPSGPRSHTVAWTRSCASMT